MDVSGVSAEAAVMAAAGGSGRANAAELGVAVLARAQRESRQQAAALVSLIAASIPRPGVGENLSVYA